MATTGRARARGALRWAVLAVLSITAVSAQVATDGAYAIYTPENAVQWVRSPEVMRRLALGFDALVADVYWIRAVQYYGATKLSDTEDKNYDLLYPMLDITTGLDPRFNIAYRFGAILLSEGYPNGPGRPDQAVALLEKGIGESPDRWEYYYDAGFIYYWWRDDAKVAADWFLRGAARPGAPNWLEPLAASVLAEGGEHDTARLLWTRQAETAEQEWIRQTARTRLLQLDAEATIEQLHVIINRFYDRAGRFPPGWPEVVAAGLIPGIPLDPAGVAYTIDPVAGVVDLDPTSALYPLRRNARPGVVE